MVALCICMCVTYYWTKDFVVDTLETCITWDRLSALRSDIKRVFSQAYGGNAFVGCHLSHLYRDGASAYFTFIAEPGVHVELDQWRDAKKRVHAMIAQNRGATSHQHGVGTMHADLYTSVHDNTSLMTPTIAKRLVRSNKSLQSRKITRSIQVTFRIPLMRL